MEKPAKSLLGMWIMWRRIKMKKIYIVTYHNGEYEDSIEWNLIALPTRAEAELFIESLIEYWNNPVYPDHLDFLFHR